MSQSDEIARLMRDNDRLAALNDRLAADNATITRRLTDMIEAYDKQAEELSALRADYNAINDFEQSQCHKMLVELTHAGREIDRLRRLLDGAKEDCDKLLAAGKVLEGEVAALTAERDGWRSLLQSELCTRLDATGEAVKLTERIAMARLQRSKYRSWADRLALSLSLCNDGDVILLAYRQWRGDRP